MLLNSFEHDFVEEETRTDASAKKGADDHVRLESGTTRWNAKVDNFYSDVGKRNYEDRISNFLQYA